MVTARFVVCLAAAALGPTSGMVAAAGTGAVQEAPAVGRIRGRVDIPGPAPTAARRPTVTDLGMPAPREEPDRKRAIVYLENAPTGAFDQRSTARAEITQRQETFIPHVLAVRVGTTVDFPNEDETYHNVFSLSKVRRFDLGRYAAGRSKPVRFDEPGVVRVFCDIHSHMSAFVLVFNHRFFATTDADGRYSLPDVPPGRYTVTVWYDGSTRDSRTVTVPTGGGVVDLDFVLR